MVWGLTEKISGIFRRGSQNNIDRGKAKEGIEDWLEFVEESYSRAAEQIDDDEKS